MPGDKYVSQIRGGQGRTTATLGRGYSRDAVLRCDDGHGELSNHAGECAPRASAKDKPHRYTSTGHRSEMRERITTAGGRPGRSVAPCAVSRQESPAARVVDRPPSLSLPQADRRSTQHYTRHPAISPSTFPTIRVCLLVAEPAGPSKKGRAERPVPFELYFVQRFSYRAFP